MLGEGVLDFVFPPRCGGCGRSGSWFCQACRGLARRVPVARCGVCHRVCVVDPCPICPADRAGPESMVAWFVLEGPVREVIHKLKYGDRPNLAGPLVELGLTRGDLPTGVVVPVPLGLSRRRRRGYNQAEALALKIAAATGRQRLEGLRRVRETDAQVGRSGEERRLALAGAFAWRGWVPKEILLVDDVVTTGATLVECARAARAAGVKCVHTFAAALG